jgi:hypothetical protein
LDNPPSRQGVEVGGAEAVDKFYVKSSDTGLLASFKDSSFCNPLILCDLQCGTEELGCVARVLRDAPCPKENFINARHLLATGSLALGLLAASSVQATTWSFGTSSGFGSTLANQLSSYNVSYNDANGDFRLRTTFAPNTSVDGYWFVASASGQNPKGTFNELAILYADFGTKRVSAFEYNGQNDANSYNSNASFIGRYENALTQVGNTWTLSINDAAIRSFNDGNNGADWTGIKFGQNIGIWFHWFDGSFTYNASNKLTGVHIRSQGWSDRTGDKTTKVPVPATLPLIGLGLVGLGLLGRRGLVRK